MTADRMEQVQGKKVINAGFAFAMFSPPSLLLLALWEGLLMPDGDFHYFRAVRTTKDDFEPFSISDLELLEKQ